MMDCPLAVPFCRSVVNNVGVGLRMLVPDIPSCGVHFVQTSVSPMPRVLALVLLAVLNVVFADCNMCIFGGDCREAYHGHPGRSCGVVATRACCCPLNARCASSPYECRCAAPPTQAPTPAAPTVVEVIGVVIAAVIFFAVVMRCSKKRKDIARRASSHRAYSPVPAQPVYVAPIPSYMPPPPAVVYVHDTPHHYEDSQSTFAGDSGACTETTFAGDTGKDSGRGGGSTFAGDF
ncbi:Aste57867_23257 [Aphanomyces stellatus]|uniref:Aste57867_23257 protein n=1 Tax=Aphanomyces stellatus TaxID=120398 RepID=A0A485LMC2_9STRA|nr:hypothetical protein As57867_023186 [Aphanomyces stellatus]VFT99902.1 Aste57867_23257 [Aphanomyces stellatus]